jgi:hypothetical protein
MFDKVSQAAEKLATGVSRRAFLGRLGQGALATAGVLGAMLAFRGQAQADQPQSTCCVCPTGLGPIAPYSYACVAVGSPCPYWFYGCRTR